MSYKTKLKIGEFSQMMQVTVKTLRHYEQKGLLKPDEVDEWTGYRYYTVEQMQRLNSIRELQQLGFSLDEIGLLYEDDSHDPTIGQLSRKIRDTEQQLRMLMDRREKLLNWRRSLKEIRTMEKFSIQSLPEIIVASHREVIPSYEAIGEMCCNVIGPEMQRLGCKCPPPGYCFTVEHNKEYTRLMKELQDKLGLQKLPYRIELFDNSNISGSDAVAGMVVYKGMKKSKQDYRKYNIKTVEGPDDYASMQEVTFRRYRDGEDLPDLIICDGGIGQMHCVREVVEDQLHLNIPIAGLAKNDKHRTQELLFLKDNGAGEKETITIQLKPESELFKILTQMQDEVHRYAISFHRDKRSKHALQSELDNIPGIGPKTKEILLQKYKTVKNIRAACGGAPSDVTALIGPAKVKVLTDYFSENNGENVSRGT